MPSLIDEQTTFHDTDGLPIVNGKIYIGSQNNNPVANLITIYSDRDLTVPLANPQSTDAYGKSVNKIWIPGKYSIQVNTSADVQKYQDLDAGDITQTGISVLSNVQGTNTITADGSPAIATLTDQQQYNFTTAGANTGAVTLQIDLTAAKSILKQHDVALVSGDLEANQIVSVVYNATDDVFELVSNVTSSTFDTLTVTTSATIAGDPVVPARTQETGHIRAGNTQIYTGESGSPSSLDLIASVTVDTWESVGPAGSGADNLPPFMDLIPVEAKVVILDIYINANSAGSGDTILGVYTAQGDDATPSASAEHTLRAAINAHADAADEAHWCMQEVLVPLGPTNQDFQVNWTQSNTQATRLIQLYYRGFITD